MKNQRVLYEFDDFRVDSGQFLLIRQGQPQPITPTVFRILLFLLENAGRDVTKEDLIARVWPDSFVEEGNLNRNISTLRKALGERPQDHHYIETIPKTGYRFVAEVRRVEYLPATTTAPMSPLASRPIGHDSERRTLRAAFEAMKESRGGILCLNAEAGSGKTALVQSFLSDLVDSGETIHLAASRCSEALTEPEPYGPFLECLSAMEKNESIAETVRSLAPTWHRELTQTGDESATVANGNGRMKREMYELLRAMSAAHPVVLFIDDFHWADVASVELLAFLSVRLLMMRVLVVVCIRPYELTVREHAFRRVRSHLLSSGVMKEIAVMALSKADVRQYVSSQLADSSNVDELADLVFVRSEGNPLFMIEIVRALQQDATFTKRQDAAPESLRNMIRSRLDPLDDTERALLAAASVQGFEFDSAILSKSLAMRAEDVEEKLQHVAETYGLIRKLRDEELMDGKFTVRYSFVHSLYQIVCHETLTPTRKASLNSAVAEAFLAYYGN